MIRNDWLNDIMNCVLDHSDDPQLHIRTLSLFTILESAIDPYAESDKLPWKMADIRVLLSE